jgi:hypothetical protein
MDIHRLIVPWTEQGATFNCAVDAVPANTLMECTGNTNWSMAGPSSPPWVTAGTARATVTTGMTGVVEFDVTADVAAFLAGAPNSGWIIKKTDEGKQGRIVFMTKESGQPPELVLTITGAGSDTTRPAIPAASGLPSTPTSTVAHPNNAEALYYRDFVAIAFSASTSGNRVREVLAQYYAQVVGGVPGLAGVELYYVHVPDPGPSWADLESLLQRMSQETGVESVLPLRFGERPTLRGRYPIDSLIAPIRESWFTNTGMGAAQKTINSLNSIRAPLAWGCETGQYGSSPPSIGIIDYFFDGPTTDLNVTHVERPTGADVLVQTIPSADEVEHGLGVAGVAAAIGDNGVGTTGVAWGAPLHHYAFATNGQTPTNLLRPFFRALNLASQANVQVVSMSATFGGTSPHPSVVREIVRALQWYLDGSDRRLIVLALPELRGGTGMNSTLSAVAAGQVARAEALDIAAAQLALQPTYTDRILFVAGNTALGGTRWGAL